MTAHHGEYPLARARWRREREAREAERLAARRRVESIAREVLAAEEVEAAYLVGSLVEPGAYDAASDIDIAVAGLAPNRYLAVLGTLMERIGTEDVDLIELERVPFREMLERRGERIV
jgi:predicted nucleotidyltransferase